MTFQKYLNYMYNNIVIKLLNQKSLTGAYVSNMLYRCVFFGLYSVCHLLKLPVFLKWDI